MLEHAASQGIASTDESGTSAPSVRADVGGSTAGGAEEAADADAVIAVRQERAVSRILEDERLRGDLTDDEYQPLLDWAIAVTDQVAVSTAELDDEAAQERLDGSTHALAEILEAAGYAIVAHHEGDAGRRRRELVFIGERLEAALAWTSTTHDGSGLTNLADRLDAEPERTGTVVAHAIVGALNLSDDDQEAR